MRENVAIYVLVALIFGLAAGGMYLEWSWGWLDWIEGRRSSRTRSGYYSAVFIANVIVAGIIVFIPVQLFGPKDQKEDTSE